MTAKPWTVNLVSLTLTMTNLGAAQTATQCTPASTNAAVVYELSAGKGQLLQAHTISLFVSRSH